MDDKNINLNLNLTKLNKMIQSISSNPTLAKAFNNGDLNLSNLSLEQGNNVTECEENCSHDHNQKKHLFWKTQPVPKFGDDINDHSENGPIIIYEDINYNNKKTHKIYKNSLDFDDITHNYDHKASFKSIKHTPYPLPSGFEWSLIDILKSDELQELYTLLSENYVEDEDNMFRFDYKPEFLQWALKPPGWKNEWHVGIRVKVPNNSGDNLQSSKGKLVSFISAIPAKICVQGDVLRCVEINFLCVHKKLRSKRISPVLISEITRRVNLHHIWYAVYTAGVILPKPCAVTRYWHRSLNAKKLIEIKFSHLTKNMTVSRALKLYKLPDTLSIPGLRPLKVTKNNRTDIVKGCKLLNTYLASQPHQLYPIFDELDFEHWFIPRTGVVETYVIENCESGELTDMFSFYALPSTVMNHPTYKNLFAAYSFYNVSNSLPLVKLMSEALVAAKLKGYDVYNALDLMDNKQFLEELKFGIGDGHLQYYLFNWRCKYMKPEEIALVLQ